MTTINDKQKIYLANVAKTNKKKRKTFLKKKRVTSAKVKVAQNLINVGVSFYRACYRLGIPIKNYIRVIEWK